MRILHITPYYLPAVRYGGPVVSIHGLCVGLISAGHHVDVYTTNVDGSGVLPVEICTLVPLEGVGVTYFPCSCFNKLYFSLQLTFALIRNVRNYDLIHIHSIFNFPAYIAARVAHFARVPYVLAPRGALVKRFVKGKSFIKKSLWIFLIERVTIRRAAFIHFTSEHEVSEFQRFSIKSRKSVVIPNGISITPMSMQGLSKPSMRRGGILFLGRLSWEKGVDWLIREMEHVDASLSIVGDGPVEYREKLEILVDSLGLRERVHFIGPLYGEPKLNMLRTHRLLVIPSYSENFSNVALEAWANYCPVLMTTGVGLAAVALESNCASLLDPTEESLSERISTVLADTEYLDEIAANGLRLVTTTFSWREVSDRMEKEYKEVLDRSEA